MNSQSRAAGESGDTSLQEINEFLVETSEELMLFVSGDGRVLAANAAFLSAFGLAREAVIGCRATEIALREVRQIVSGREFAAASTGRICRSSRWIERPDSGNAHLDCTWRPWRRKDGSLSGVAIVLRDSTLSKRAEEALRESEERLRTIIDSEPECVKTVSPDCRLLHMNPAGLELIEARDLNEVINAPLLDLIDPAYHDEYKAFNERVIGGSTEELQFELISLNGTRRWMDTRAAPLHDRDGNVIAQLSVTRDITERMRLQKELEASESLYRSLYNDSPVLLLAMDAEMKIEVVSDQWLATLRYERSEVIGQSVLKFLAPAARDYIRKIMTAEVGDSARSRQAPLQWLRSDGELLELLLWARPFRENGVVVRVLTVLMDISDRLRDEERLQDYAQRLSTLSQRLLSTQETERHRLARELHEEVGQSLTALRINLHIAQARIADSTSHAALHDSIAIVDRTLDQVRDLSLDLRPSMLDDLGLLSAIRWFLARQAERASCIVQLHAPETLPRLPHEIETGCYRIVQEAVSNVLRHAQAGRVDVRLAAERGVLTLSIEDNGVGFDVAASRSGALAGNSFGLLGMQERVQLLGGTCAIRSAATGTTVEARFPLSGRRESTLPQSSVGQAH